MNAPVRKTVRPPTIIEKVENALLDQLAGKLNEKGRRVGGSIPLWVDVEAWPEDPKDFDFSGKQGALLIHYSGSRFAEPEGLSTNQTRAMSWSMVLMTRSLNGEKGAYAVLEDIRQALQGFGAEGGGPIRMVSDELTAEQEGVWEWRIVVALPIAAVAKRPASRPSPVFQNAT